jgi:hypothetical protein
VTHVSGNFEMLGFNVNVETEAIFEKETKRRGSRPTYQYFLKLKNRDAGESLSIQLDKKPINDIVEGMVNCSTWKSGRSFQRTDSCTVEVKKETIEIVFLKADRQCSGVNKKVKLNRLGAPLKDAGEIFDAIKYLRLDATPA